MSERPEKRMTHPWRNWRTSLRGQRRGGGPASISETAALRSEPSLVRVDLIRVMITGGKQAAMTAEMFALHEESVGFSELFSMS